MQLVWGITVFLAYEAVYIDMEPEIYYPLGYDAPRYR